MKRIALLLVMVVLFAGCDRDTDFLITIKTPFGDMKAILFDDTPLHKENFIKLAKEGRFDSTTFHRIINEFMVQGGDINRKEGDPQAIDYKIDAEFVKKRFHRKGAIAAARQPDQVNPQKKSSGSQFYIVHGRTFSELEVKVDQMALNQHVGTLMRMPGYDSLREAMIAAYNQQQFDAYMDMMFSLIPDVEEKLGQNVMKDVSQERIDTYATLGGAPQLDDEYTVFGQVIEGLDVIDKLAVVETTGSPTDRPLQDYYMVIEVEEVAKKKISKEYGVNYGVEE